MNHISEAVCVSVSCTDVQGNSLVTTLKVAARTSINDLGFRDHHAHMCLVVLCLLCSMQVHQITLTVPGLTVLLLW